MENNKYRPKIEKISIVDQVYENLKKNIEAGAWAVGDKLPSEAELANEFGVNRLSVRMALQKLNTLGFIETRVGEGSYVQEFSLRSFVNEIFPFYSESKKYQEIQQLRELLEGECIRIAIESALPEDLEKIKLALEVYEAQIKVYCENNECTQGLEDLVIDDFAFHYAIIEASHNGLFLDIYYMIQKVIQDHIRKLICIRTCEEKTQMIQRIDIHRELYDNILRGDYAAALKVDREIIGADPINGLEEKKPLE